MLKEIIGYIEFATCALFLVYFTFICGRDDKKEILKYSEELEQSLKDLVEAKEDLIDSQDKLIERLKENLYLKEQLLAKQKTIKSKGSIQKSFVNDKIKNNIK